MPQQDYQDYYEILGLDPKQKHQYNQADIRRAYRKKALENHPDKHPPEERANVEVKFKLVGAAYAILSDPNQRANYDRGINYDTPPPNPSYQKPFKPRPFDKYWTRHEAYDRYFTAEKERQRQAAQNYSEEILKNAQEKMRQQHEEYLKRQQEAENQKMRAEIIKKAREEARKLSEEMKRRQQARIQKFYEEILKKEQEKKQQQEDRTKALPTVTLNTILRSHLAKMVLSSLLLGAAAVLLVVFPPAGLAAILGAGGLVATALGMSSLSIAAFASAFGALVTSGVFALSFLAWLAIKGINQSANNTKKPNTANQDNADAKPPSASWNGMKNKMEQQEEATAKPANNPARERRTNGSTKSNLFTQPKVANDQSAHRTSAYRQTFASR